MNNRISTHEKRLRFFGKWIITPFFSIGSGMITTVAVSTLGFIAGLALPYLIPILAAIFLAESVICIYFFKNSVPDTLADLFLNNIFRDLNNIKKIILGVGLFSALGAGLSLGAVTYVSSITAVASVLGLLSLSFPPLGIAVASILAFTGFISISGLFIKWIASAIKNDMHKQIARFFVNLVTRDPSKFLVQQILEGSFKLLFTTTFVLLAAVGTIATLGTMHAGLAKFLMLIPQANILAVKISSGIISYGLMGIARLPWALQSLCSVSSKIGEVTGRFIFGIGEKIATKLNMHQPVPVLVNNSDNLNATTVLSSIAKVSVMLIHGFSFGALARTGGGSVLSNIITSANTSIPSQTIEKIGQISSIVSGGTMAAGVSAFSLFQKNERRVNRDVRDDLSEAADDLPEDRPNFR